MEKCESVPTLLISKINGIVVQQVGVSALQATNNHVNDHKIGISFLGNGENRTIDLGKGEKKYSIKVETNDHFKSKALLNVCENVRYCTIVDKWKGRISAYITDYKVVDADEHMNVTIFEISFSEQDSLSTSFVSFFSFFTNLFSLVDSLIVKSISTLLELDKLNNYSAHNELESALESLVIDLMSNTLDPMSIAKFEHYENIADIKSYIKLLSVNPIESASYLSKKISAVSDTTIQQNAKIFEVKHFEMPKDALVSQLEYNMSLLHQEFATLENLFILKNELSIINNATFATQEQFDRFISSALDRSIALGLDSDVINTLKQYAAEKEYRDIEQVQFDKDSLVPYVYYRYGNLDNLPNILLLNDQLSETDLISGNVKVYL